MVSARNCRNRFISAVCCARTNSAREFHGHGCSSFLKSNFGNFTPRFEMKLTTLGKLSSNGPRRPFGYQMKWPMPSDAKSSPSFHAVSPEIVPLHSFCQIFFPILRTSPCESVIPQDMCGESKIVEMRGNRAKKRRRNSQECCFLDGRHLSISVRVSAAVILTGSAQKNTIL